MACCTEMCWQWHGHEMCGKVRVGSMEGVGKCAWGGQQQAGGVRHGRGRGMGAGAGLGWVRGVAAAGGFIVSRQQFGEGVNALSPGLVEQLKKPTRKPGVRSTGRGNKTRKGQDTTSGGRPRQEVRLPRRRPWRRRFATGTACRQWRRGQPNAAQAAACRINKAQR